MSEGSCECGCGQHPTISDKTDRRAGSIKGEPRRFVVGHNRRGFSSHLPLDDSAYEAEDRGYATPCWIWIRGCTSLGYGHVHDPAVGKQRPAYAVVYERERGPVPAGYELDHLCRQPPCVNPDHLEPVSHATNIRRSKAAKLTMEKAEEIRRLHAAGRSKRSLAAEYDVSRTVILAVIRRKSWA